MQGQRSGNQGDKSVQSLDVTRLPAKFDGVSDWVKREQPAFNKPTKFKVRDGSF
jgi:hypothetical protein